MKQLTGGDTITVRPLYGKFFDFVPRFKIWLAANHLPKIRGTDEGIWRRVRLIPFTVNIPAAEVQKNLGEMLLDEWPGILAWVVRGAKEWHAHGLQEPLEVLDATAAYRKASDPIQDFLSVCVVKSEGAVAFSDVYDAYTWWAQEWGMDPLRKWDLSRAMSKRGFEAKPVRIERRDPTKAYPGLLLTDVGRHFAVLAKDRRSARVNDPSAPL